MDLKGKMSLQALDLKGRTIFRSNTELAEKIKELVVLRSNEMGEKLTGSDIIRAAIMRYHKEVTERWKKQTYRNCI